MQIRAEVIRARTKRATYWMDAHNAQINYIMSIEEILKSERNITIAVSAADLKEFALTIIAEQKNKKEIGSVVDRMLSPKETADILGVSLATLWRWEKTGYLVPRSRIGKKPIYMESQLTALRNGGAE